MRNVIDMLSSSRRHRRRPRCDEIWTRALRREEAKPISNFAHADADADRICLAIYRPILIISESTSGERLEAFSVVSTARCLSNYANNNKPIERARTTATGEITVTILRAKYNYMRPCVIIM